MRLTISLLLFLSVFGCGAYEQRSTGIDEDTLLVIRGDSLVGLTVSISPDFSRTISKSDLTRYQMGVLGATDKEVENLETVALKVDSGSREVRIADGTSVLLLRTLHFVEGQTRELRLR